MRSSGLSTIALLFLLYQSASTSPAARYNFQEHETTTDSTVPAFTATQEPAIQALLRLSRAAHMPIGIVVEGDALCRTRVSFSAENTPVSVIASGIATQVPGYGAASRADSPMVIAAPLSMRPSTSEFLQLIDARYTVKGNLQTLTAMLWVHVLAILHPQEGSAGSIPGSTNDRIFRLDLSNSSIEQILDRIALQTNGVWVLRPLPSRLTDLGVESPIEVQSAFGQSGSRSADLCAPVRTTSQH